MPTFADNYTFRVRGSYVAAGVQHKMKVRGNSVINGETAAETYANALNDYISNFEANLWTDWSWLGWEYADPNSDIWIPFNPVLVGGDPTGVINPASYTAVKKAYGLTHSGRVAGSRARLYWFGAAVLDEAVGAVGGNGVISVGEFAGLAASTTLATDTFRGGNGQPAIFYERLTVKVNDDVLKLVRRGTIT